VCPSIISSNLVLRFPQRYDEHLFSAHYAELKKLADKVMAGYDNLFNSRWMPLA